MNNDIFYQIITIIVILTVFSLFIFKAVMNIKKICSGLVDNSVSGMTKIYSILMLFCNAIVILVMTFIIAFLTLQLSIN